MALSEFENLIHKSGGLARMNQVYWTEMLQRAHLAACTSLRRNLGWISAVALCHSHENYLGFAASLRGLIESVGDSTDVLTKIPKNIARENKTIKCCIDGRENSMAVASRELEDELISYSHARRTKKHEDVPDSHVAKQTQYYVKLLSDDADLPKLELLYKELCEVMHPAATSVLYQFSAELGPDGEAIYSVNTQADHLYVEKTLREFRNIIIRLVYLAFDPGLITLKVLHRFKIFCQIPELRRFDFALHQLAKGSLDLMKN